MANDIEPRAHPNSDVRVLNTYQGIIEEAKENAEAGKPLKPKIVYDLFKVHIEVHIQEGLLKELDEVTREVVARQKEVTDLASGTDIGRFHGAYRVDRRSGMVQRMSRGRPVATFGGVEQRHRGRVEVAHGGGHRLRRSASADGSTKAHCQGRQRERDRAG